MAPAQGPTSRQAIITEGIIHRPASTPRPMLHGQLRATACRWIHTSGSESRNSETMMYSGAFRTIGVFTYDQ